MPTPIIELTEDRYENILSSIRDSLNKETGEVVESIMIAYRELLQELDQQGITIRKLRQMVFGSKTESKKNLLPDDKNPDDTDTPKPPSDKSNDSKGEDVGAEPSGGEDASPSSEEESSEDDEKKGHGRYGTGSYPNATWHDICHKDLSPGCTCPRCLKGKLVKKKPVTFVHITGVAPFESDIFRRESLRCMLCGEVFNAELPPEVGKDKYAPNAVAMMILLKYNMGIPFTRLDRLQSLLATPLARSTQWDKIKEASDTLVLLFEELATVAANAELIHIDDTTARILDLMGKRREKTLAKLIENDPSVTIERESTLPIERKGVYTTGIVAQSRHGPIALYFTGRNHAGDNMGHLLDFRNADSTPPIQMSDSLQSNMSQELKTIIAKCLVHARRNFVDILQNFPEQCKYVIDVFSDIYKNESITHKEEMTPDERLAYHQEHTSTIMDDFYDWLNRQINEKLVHPNSSLGKAVAYCINHWHGLTLFLREAGAPLDNNICERALKKAIMNRKNSLFYRSQRGSAVGDICISLLHTCELHHVNPFEYLVAVLNNKKLVAERPELWLPWNYEDAPSLEQKITG